MQPSGPDEPTKAESVRILLLEDQQVTADVEVQYLRAIRGLALELDVVKTLADARAHLERSNYDLLLVDLHVPDSSGLATLDAIAPRTNALIIVTTADTD